MSTVAQTIAPTFLLVVLGYLFRRGGFPGDGFWRPAEKLSYYVLLPVLVVRNLAGASLAGVQFGELALLIVGVAVAMTAVALALRPAIRVDGGAFTSVVQGTIRLNSYIGFGVADALYGAPGVVRGALFVAVMMPTVNAISIAALAAFAHTGKPEWRRVPIEIAKNPIILACVIGGAMNALHLGLPDWADGLLAILARSALPIALLCVGAGLALPVGRGALGALGLVCLLKLAVMPALAFGGATLIGLGGLTLPVAVLFSATPASPASYVLARQLGGDATLMAGILTAETVLAALTIPLIAAWLV